jgi:AcrR family transcriptional regulator
MPRASAAAAAATAATILETGSALFSAHGFGGVSLDDVAGAAGVTRGAVYHHYANKLGLFQAVANTLQARVADEVVSAAEAAGDAPADQLAAGCHAFLDAITATGTAQVLLVDAPAVVGWARWRELDASHSAAHLKEALASTGLEPALIEATTAQLSGAMNEAALWLVDKDGESGRPDSSASREQAHRALDRLLGAALGS